MGWGRASRRVYPRKPEQLIELYRKVGADNPEEAVNKLDIKKGAK